MKKERIIRYKGQNLIVYFSVDRCTHVAECLRGAPNVFNTQRKPWIMPDEDPADHVAEVIETCPTGSLRYQRLDGGKHETPPARNTVTIEASGPVYIHGDIQLTLSNGETISDTRIALCRCGATEFKPICDGAHDDIDFKDPGQIKESDIPKSDTEKSEPLQVRIVKDGPLILQGSMTLVDADERRHETHRAVLCRCGASKRMPFCDGSHAQVGFKSE
jgi:CDGSH-type Zn-finger protein/uncharacterized Fe-S cluster protein YjdI